MEGLHRRLFSMARTGNGNANAIVYMAQDKENESFSSGIEEISVLKLLPAERTTFTDDQLAVAVASMNAWVAIKKKGRGGRRVEAEKEKKEAPEREQAKALKDKEKAEKKAAAAGKDDDDDGEEGDLSGTLEKVRWVKVHCNKKSLMEIVPHALKLQLGKREEMADAIARKLQFSAKYFSPLAS